MSWYIQAIKNYCNFSGRARRTEYWMFALISAVIVFVPVVGAIILLVFSLKPGTIGANNYGADPKDTYIG